MKIKKTISTRAAEYAVGSDFCRIFKEDMNSMYLLSLLLTADPDKAEQCFVSGFEDSLGANQVFKDWAESWARRAVIKNAIRLIGPGRAEDDGRSGHADSSRAQNAATAERWPALPAEFAAVMALQPFERFAFVITALEGYSDRDCALLLGCTPQSLSAARIQAQNQIAQSAEVEPVIHAPAQELHDRGASVIGLTVPAPLGTVA